MRQVREVDADRLLIVATDRISAYDWIMPTPIPDKGRILTALSAFWFGRTTDIVPNHLIELVGDRAMLVQRLRMLPIECVARGYLVGSGWKDYQETGAVCGHRLPAGLRQADRLPRADLHAGDQGHRGPRHEHQPRRGRGDGGRRRAGRGRADHAGALRAAPPSAARAAGMILADTKFELGHRRATARLMLGDEAVTPDSSRLWPADRWAPGQSPPSFDKQYLRDWLDEIGWDHSSPPPELPDEVVEGTRARYIEAHERITEVDE